MKKTLNILTAGIFALATGTTILTSINHINTTKNHNLQKENASNETALFNNNYGYLNNSDWITNQSTTDHKYYSYDTSALKSYHFANARKTFLVDTTGNLIANPDVTIPDNQKINIANTKQEMINYRKVTAMKTDPNHSDASNFSNYQQNNFVGDNNWTYLQLGGLEQTIDISNIPTAAKIENNSHLSESLGLYYIVDAVINNKISLAIANNIGQEFINRSSLQGQIDNSLIKTIINLIADNNIFKFISSSPLLQNIKDYSLNFIFDNDNNLIAIYYQKWNVQDITQNMNYHYQQDFNNINNHDWSANDKKTF
ncbi:hypothetical protein [Spiroplasma endosymbiont of Polydrusus pterygomalis]|uniref:hypothetical protein n=1 Tax=Spiroplasma endosymbiont of Polydrusus pterygomalis TaxID=3139327 RepID=UPI003CCB6EB9